MTGQHDDSSPDIAPTIKTRAPADSPGSVVVVLDADPGAAMAVATDVANFTENDSRAGQCYWIDIDQRHGDLVVPSHGKTQLMDMDGSWDCVVTTIDTITERAAEAVRSGEPPTVLVINTVNGLNDALRDSAYAAAICNADGPKDPYSPIVLTTDDWRTSNARWNHLFTMLRRFPGIVVALSRTDGAASPGNTYVRPDLPNGLLHKVTACVQYIAGNHPTLLVGNTPAAADRVLTSLPDLNLSDLLWDVLALPSEIKPLPVRFGVGTAVTWIHAASGRAVLDLFPRPHARHAWAEAIDRAHLLWHARRNGPGHVSPGAVKAGVRALLQARTMAELEARMDRLRSQHHPGDLRWLEAYEERARRLNSPADQNDVRGLAKARPAAQSHPVNARSRRDVDAPTHVANEPGSVAEDFRPGDEPATAGN
ncbi:hypothetical protein ACIGO9_30800 [Nocardia asteroides]|uniref:hypothetical protein n=1 Tax=Nocardia asteroides TaxID=1824 RepID=UPI0037C79B42